MNTNRYPLAYDLDGNPIVLPPEAVAWRVRRRSGKQGRPQCVYDHETGAQLEIALDATIDDLRDYGPGVYRLDAIDKDGKVLPGVVAQTEVPLPDPAPPEPNEPYGSRTESAALIKHLVDANVRTMEAMASAFGQVRPVQQEAQPIVMTAAADGSKAEGEWAQVIPLIPTIVQQVVMGLQQVIGAIKTGVKDGSNGAPINSEGVK